MCYGRKGWSRLIVDVKSQSELIQNGANTTNKILSLILNTPSFFPGRRGWRIQVCIRREKIRDVIAYFKRKGEKRKELFLKESWIGNSFFPRLERVEGNDITCFTCLTTCMHSAQICVYFEVILWILFHIKGTGRPVVLSTCFMDCNSYLKPNCLSVSLDIIRHR